MMFNTKKKSIDEYFNNLGLAGIGSSNVIKYWNFVFRRIISLCDKSTPFSMEEN